jgi:hypothetical protein
VPDLLDGVVDVLLIRIGWLAEGFDLLELVAAEFVDFFVE